MFNRNRQEQQTNKEYAVSTEELNNQLQQTSNPVTQNVLKHCIQARENHEHIELHQKHH